MSQFMVEFNLPEFTEDFVARIPFQRLKINEMLETGKIHSYAVSADRNRMWCVVNAKSEIEVMSILAEFPLRDYLSPNINELMFHNSVILKVPAFSLN
jgi:muconolactone delta-isomerase